MARAGRRGGVVSRERSAILCDAPRYERREKAMTTLPEDMRTVIVLRRIHGLSSKEAAERMGRSDDATRKLYSRAMARLAMALGAATV